MLIKVKLELFLKKRLSPIYFNKNWCKIVSTIADGRLHMQSQNIKIKITAFVIELLSNCSYFKQDIWIETG